MNKTTVILISLLFSALCTNAQKLTMQRQYVSIVVDGSYSMNAELGTHTKIACVAKSLETFFGKLENYGEIQSSLSVFGTKHNSSSPEKCSDYSTLVPFEMGNTPKLKAMAKRIEPLGGSPVTDALQKTAEAMPNDGTKKYIIIIVDGGDGCQKPLCETYKALDPNTNGIFIIGIGISTEDQALFSCAPTFANATNEKELNDSLDRIFNLIKPY